MRIKNALCILAIAASALLCGPAAAQSQNMYYDSTPWPLPADGSTSVFKLNGMTTAHAIMMSFTRYADGKPVTDSPIITLMPGSTARWSAPEGGCTYELELVDANPPLINMKKPYSICSLRTGNSAIFRILAIP
ncbi:MAG: hypothetical protein JWN94_4609 [Betaproteobacteria bacterium]|nr:hypothetical protein [Betaproteobacteria bacterium]